MKIKIEQDEHKFTLKINNGGKKTRTSFDTYLDAMIGLKEQLEYKITLAKSKEQRDL